MAERPPGDLATASQMETNGDMAALKDTEMANGEEVDQTAQQSQTQHTEITPASPAGSIPNPQLQHTAADSAFTSGTLEASQTSVSSTTMGPIAGGATPSAVPSTSLQQQPSTLPPPGPGSSSARASPAPVTPGILPPSAIMPPAKPHGSPTRVYLNTKVTPHLLEGLKYVGKHEPEKPLKWLSEYLARKSAEVEGG